MVEARWVACAALAATLSGCGAPPTPQVATSTAVGEEPVGAPAPGHRRHARPTSASTTSCYPGRTTDFVDEKVLWLPVGGFSFPTNGGTGLKWPPQPGYSPPRPEPFSIDITPNYQKYRDALMGAFKIAPSWVRDGLCKVTWVFVEAADATPGPSQGAWSFWENPFDQDAGQNTYIAVSESILDRQPNLSTVAAATNNALLRRNAPSAPVVIRTSIDNASDNSSMALLGLLTHELGHLAIAKDPPLTKHWAECTFWNSDSTGWSDIGARGRIHSFGEALGNEIPAGADSIISINRDMINANYATAVHKLQILFGKAAWANVFAADASDFDLTQTLALKALMEASPPLQAMTVDVGHPLPLPGSQHTADIYSQFKDPGSILHSKSQCLEDHWKHLP